ncbi:GNAT family N-acetyltransferase [Tessaracoccus caeni]|uniref:GNAT family N-acetyltransferase n=1 Tax=Tessaracoccus caeni TaxID=3031239 RepID=UPI0023DA904C|nr:GNAT family N-acetyltransferase [Tessaracoccus caeni]MDF1488280.1 GNAT family N-acetyltransferase [Tessaracoccus caeni]
MIVTPAEERDAQAIAALEDTFEPLERWSLESWRQEILGDDRLVLAAKRKATGEVLGAASYQLVDGTADLNRIVVAPTQRRLGLARLMLVRGLEWAVERGAVRMMLEVRADNDAALTLYRSHGFAQIATRPRYYGGTVDALVMERGLVGVDSHSVGNLVEPEELS